MKVDGGKAARWAAYGLVFLLVSFPRADMLWAQGQPAIRNYPPKEYGAHNQNWAIVQDTQGLMYFGNSEGVLEYDGVSWQLIPISGFGNIIDGI